MPHTANIRMVVLLILCAATISFFTFSARYTASGPELLKNPQFENGLSQWQHSGNGVSALTDKSGTVVLSSRDPAALTHITQSISAPQRFHLLRFSADLKTINVKKGDASWKLARLVLVSFNASGKAMYHLPHALIGKSGNNGWDHYEKVFRVDKDASEIQLSAQLMHATGSMWVKNISLQPVRERADFSGYRMIMIWLWFLVMAWVIIPLARSIADSPAGLAAALLVLFIAIGALLPESAKKHVDQSLPSSLSAIEHASPPLKSQDVPAKQVHSSPAINIYKLGHFALFAILSVVIFLGSFRNMSMAQRAGYLLMLALITETLQFFVAGRDARLFDLLLDAGGVMAGAALSKLFLFARKTHAGIT